MLLDAGEKAQADLGYRGEPRTCCIPNEFDRLDVKVMKKEVRSRQEHVNKRLKQFQCLKQQWRHGIEKHKPAFTAVAVITQLAFENHEPLHSVRYGAHRLL